MERGASDPSGGVPDTRDSLDELRAAVDQLRADGIHNPKLRPSGNLLRSLSLDPASPALRRQLAEAILSLCAHLDERLRFAFLMSAGFYSDITGTSGERVNRTATRLRIARRTVYHRIDKAVDQLANLIHDGSNRPPVESADFAMLNTACHVDLRGSYPSVRMIRTIMALTDGLNRFEDHVVLPRLGPQRPEYLAVSGCKLAALSFTANAWSASLSFPHPIRAGEQHEFQTFLRLPNHAAIEPSVIFSPITSAHRLSIGLQFDADRQPAAVERFDAVWPAHILNPATRGEPIPPTQWNSVAFSNVRPGYAYGLRWTWPDSPQLEGPAGMAATL